MCKVSVLIPVYNAKRYLEECLDSLICQTLPDIEILCIDDGSTDSSPEILRSYQRNDGRIRVITQRNGGYGRAINAGLSAARGEYVGIVEADDYVLPDMYRVLWETAHKAALDFVKSDYCYFCGEPEKRSFDRIRVCPYPSWYNRRWTPNTTPALLDADMMNVTGIYRRKFICDNHIVLRETPGAAFQDTGLWIQIFTRAESAMFLPYAFYRIRRDNPASSVMDSGRFALICGEYEAALQSLTAQQREVFAPFLFRRKVFAYQFILSKTDGEQKASFIRSLSAEIRAAQDTGEYVAGMFTPAMNCFLQETAAWQGEGALPEYRKSRSPVRRMRDCVREHGFFYLMRRVEIKLHIRREVF